MQEMSSDFKYSKVKLRKYLLNKNLTGHIFGGTLFSAGDPVHTIMLWQIFTNRGYKLQSFLKSAKIDYLKPAGSSLTAEYHITDEVIDAFEKGLREKGKHSHWFTVELVDKQGDVVARMQVESYLRVFKRIAERPAI